MRRIIFSILLFVLFSHVATAQVISFKEQYQDYQGRTLEYNTPNLIMFPMYSTVDSGNTYTISRLGDQLILPKANTVYKFNPQSISFTLTLTPAQLNSRSIQDGVNWYIPIPKPLTALRFGWDDVKPFVTTNTGIEIPDTNFWYSKVNGQTRFYYNQVARTIGASSSYLTFEFNSYTVNNATTSGWTTSNISLNGSRWTDDGSLALNLNASYLNGLVGYWSMDETQGTTIHNINTESGLINTTNQGTWNGNTTLNYTPGHIGNAGNFDGINDYINLGHDTSLNITNNITVGVWIKPNVGSMTSAPTGRIIVGKGTLFTSNYILYYLGNTELFSFAFWNGTAFNEVLSDASLSNYQHVVGTYNGTSLCIFVNGVRVRCNTPLGTPQTNSNDLYMGGSGARFFNGSIDESQIWNRALSSSEIAELYNRSMRTQAMPIISSQTATNFHVINRTRIVYTNQDSLNNISIYARQNGATAWDLIQSNATSNAWYDITNKYEVMDFGILMQGNGSNTSFFTSLEWDEERISAADEYVESTCSDVTNWGSTGFALITVLIIIIAGTIAIGWLSGTSPLDIMVTVEYVGFLVMVVALGSLTVAIVSPIFDLIGCP